MQCSGTTLRRLQKIQKDTGKQLVRPEERIFLLLMSVFFKVLGFRETQNIML